MINETDDFDSGAIPRRMSMHLCTNLPGTKVNRCVVRDALRRPPLDSGTVRAGQALVGVTRLLVACAWLVGAPALAQTEPPRVIALPSIEVPDGTEVPESGRVDVVVVIGVDGAATVEACDAGEAICALVRTAIAEARFEPARRDGVPVSARVGVALDVASPTPPDATVDGGAPDVAAPDGGAPTSLDAPPEIYGATARVRPAQPGMRRLELSEMRDLPGAFGDPFRAIDALPGVVPLLSGLPYFYVRGSPPAGTLYVYDEIAMPTLYHLAAGPAVIHPRMVGPIRLYSGVAPARSGRLLGGVVVGEGPERPDGDVSAEAELRLLDISGWIQAPVLGGDVTAAIRYGYPGLLLSIFSPDVSLAYWDYQLRYEHPLSDVDRLELVALGSYDSFGVVDDPDAALTIAFHRVETRLVRDLGATEIGSAISFGWEESTLGSDFQLTAARIGTRAWLSHRFGPRASLRISGDGNGVVGSFTTTSVDPGGPGNRGSGGERLFGDVPARSTWGLQAELHLRPARDVELQLGGRADAWITGSAAWGVLDPRARLIYHPTRQLDLHVAAGVVHQPAVFFIPLPGLADVAVDRGLQTAIQTEAGIGWDGPLDTRLELQAFVHQYRDLLFTDVIFLGERVDQLCEHAVTTQCPEAPDRVDALAYGAEVFVRRAPEERLSGWISYTLAFADVDDIFGLPYTPTWDVRHVGNVVAQWDIVGGLSAGLRLHARSGKVHTEYVLAESFQLGREELRLPWFFRLDAQVAFAWTNSWGRMRVALEWFNTTLSREPQEIRCDGEPRTCRTEYLPAIFFPNLSVRGEI
jgi:hypothetical protein